MVETSADDYLEMQNVRHNLFLSTVQLLSTLLLVNAVPTGISMNGRID